MGRGGTWSGIGDSLENGGIGRDAREWRKMQSKPAQESHSCGFPLCKSLSHIYARENILSPRTNESLIKTLPSGIIGSSWPRRDDTRLVVEILANGGQIESCVDTNSLKVGLATNSRKQENVRCTDDSSGHYNFLAGGQSASRCYGNVSQKKCQRKADLPFGPDVNSTVRNTGLPRRVPVLRRRVTRVFKRISKLERAVYFEAR